MAPRATDKQLLMQISPGETPLRPVLLHTWMRSTLMSLSSVGRRHPRRHHLPSHTLSGPGSRGSPRLVPTRWRQSIHFAGNQLSIGGACRSRLAPFSATSSRKRAPWEPPGRCQHGKGDVLAGDHVDGKPDERGNAGRLNHHSGPLTVGEQVDHDGQAFARRVDNRRATDAKPSHPSPTARSPADRTAHRSIATTMPGRAPSTPSADH